MASPKIKAIEVGGKLKYQFAVDIGIDPITGKRKQVRRTFDLRREAQAELARILHEVQTGQFVSPTKMTVGDYLEEWERSAVRKARSAAYARNIHDALRLPRERLGAVPLLKLTTRDVENLVDYALTSGRKRGGKPGTGLGNRSVQLMLGRLKAALNDAVNPRRLIPYNPALPVECPEQDSTPREPWTEVEVRQFREVLKGNRLEAPLLLSLMGLRPAEVCGLRWSDVDLEAGALTVANTRTLVDGQVIEKGPKSRKGRRPLPLPTPVLAALIKYKAQQAAERLAAGPAYAASGYVLVDEIGEPCQTDWLRRQFNKLVADAGLRRVRLYDARHATLTYLAVNGVPDVIVSAWAGHSDLSLAKRIYIHPSATDLEQGRDALSALLG